MCDSAPTSEIRCKYAERLRETLAPLAPGSRTCRTGVVMQPGLKTRKGSYGMPRGRSAITTVQLRLPTRMRMSIGKDPACVARTVKTLLAASYSSQEGRSSPFGRLTRATASPGSWNVSCGDWTLNPVPEATISAGTGNAISVPSKSQLARYRDEAPHGRQASSAGLSSEPASAGPGSSHRWPRTMSHKARRCRYRKGICSGVAALRVHAASPSRKQA